ncbi:MAG: LptF/LptG family permease [Gemmatimonadota bacterium]
MRRLDRLVAREFIRLFVLFTVAAPFLFILGDWTDRIDTYSNRGIPLADQALSYLYAYPLFMLWSLPVAGLIATVFTVSNMTRTSEVAAAKAGGVSFWRLFLPLPLLGLVATALGLGLSEVVPVTQSQAAELRGDRAGQVQSRSNFHYRAPDNWFYRGRRITGDTIYFFHGELEGDGASMPTVDLVARRAVYDSASSRWTLHDGFQREWVGEGAVESIPFDSVQPENLTYTPDEFLATPKEPDEMRYAELSAFIESLKRSGTEPLELEVERAMKLAIPVATFIIILFGMPMATTSSRGGPAYGIGISLAVTVVYLMLFKVTEALGNTGTISPDLAAWGPNALFAVAAVVLMTRVRT